MSLNAIEQKLNDGILLTSEEVKEYSSYIVSLFEAGKLAEAHELYESVALNRMSNNPLVELEENFCPEWNAQECKYNPNIWDNDSRDLVSVPIWEKLQSAEEFSWVESAARKLFALDFNVDGFSSPAEYEKIFQKAYTDIAFCDTSKAKKETDPLENERKLYNFKLLSVSFAQEQLKIECKCDRCRFKDFINKFSNLKPFSNSFTNHVNINYAIKDMVGGLNLCTIAVGQSIDNI